MLIIIIGVLLSVAAAGPYMWSTRTIDVAVEEPLTITNFPAAIRTHPGRNDTLTITIENVASVNYAVTLTFTLEDAAYQTQYVTFSNYTYAIVPGTNQIGAWMITQALAPGANLQLSVQFYRE